MGKIGVGIIGASAVRGWALTAHLPALMANPDYEIRAVAGSSGTAAQAAARAFGARLAFADFNELVSSLAVDLVVVCVKAPEHHAIVMAALAARKMVFCEWPLGRNLQEAEDMARLAQANNIPTLIGLQSRCSPIIQYLRALIADNYLGKVLSTAMVGSAVLLDGTVMPAYEYSLDPASGATLTAGPAGYGTDVLNFVLGEFKSVSSTLVTRHDTVVRQEDGKIFHNSSPDQIAFSGVLESGVLASVHYRGGPSKGHDFFWEINGTEGDLMVSIENGRLSSSRLRLWGSRGAEPLAELIPPDHYRLAPPAVAAGPAANVAALYAQFVSDRGQGTRAAPDFAAALQRHRLIDAIERAHATGCRQPVAG